MGAAVLGACANASALPCSRRPPATATRSLSCCRHVATTRSINLWNSKPCPSGHQNWPTTVRSQSFGSGEYSYSKTRSRSQQKVEELSAQIKQLEAERDEAVSVAESCAKTTMRLIEMAGMLNDVALKKVREGDEEGARQVLKEKATALSVKDKSVTRATINYALASKLAEAIGQRQAELAPLLAYQERGRNAPESPSIYPKVPTSGAAFKNEGLPSPSGTASQFEKQRLPWEKQLEEASQRIQMQQWQTQDSVQMGMNNANQAMEEALERVRSRRSEDIFEAKERLRTYADSSITEARERIIAREQAALRHLKSLVERRSRGYYVSDHEMDFAFRQVQRGWTE